MEKVTMKQLLKLLLILSNVKSKHIGLALDLSSSSVYRLNKTPSSMSFEQFNQLVRLCKAKSDMTVSMSVGSMVIHSWNFANIINLAMKEGNISINELAGRIGTNRQAFRKRISRNSCSMFNFIKTIEAMEKDLILTINGNKYLITQ